MSSDQETTMGSGGWFKTHRSLTNSDLWLAEPFTRGQAWADLIGLANYLPGHIRRRGIRVTVNRGQVGWSQETLAVRWQWGLGKVKRFLKELKVDGRISVEMGLKNIKVTALITITNYDMYQGSGPEDGLENDTENGPGIRSKEKKEKKETPSNPPRPDGGVSVRERIVFFEELWKHYPKKAEGKSARKTEKDTAKRYYRMSVKTDEDMNRINRALGNYLYHIEQEEVEEQYIKKGATFFYDWEDWVPEEASDAE